MNLKKDLNKLKNEFNKISSFDDHQIISTFHSDYGNLYKVLYEMNIDKGNYYKNIKVFMDNLDFIFDHTNSSNYLWLRFIGNDLFNKELFIERFNSYICNYPFKEHVAYIIYQVWIYLGYDKRIFDNNIDLICCGDIDTLNGFINHLDNYDRTRFVLKCLVNNKYELSFVKSFSDYEMLCLLKGIVRNRIDLKSLDLFNEFKFKNKSLAYICTNSLTFLSLGLNVYTLKRLVYNDDKTMDILNQYFDEHTNLVNDLFDYQYDNYKYVRFKELIEMIFDDIYKNEGAKLSDIKWLDRGAYSSVLQIKNKIMKIGSSRITYVFPNNPYIVKPLIRKLFLEEEDSLFIEVVERVEKREFSKEELYSFYKKLRDLDIIATDLSSDNLGVLINDNNIYWKGNLKPNYRVLGLNKTRGVNIKLKKGDVVLLDADGLFDADLPLYLLDNETREFEERYLKENGLDIESRSFRNISDITNLNNKIRALKRKFLLIDNGLLEKNQVPNFQTNYSELKYLLFSCLYNCDMAHDIKMDIICNNFKFLLEYTNESNCEWLSFDVLYRFNPSKIVYCFCKYFKNYRFSECACLIYNRFISRVYSEKLLTDEMFRQVFRFNSVPSQYIYLYDYIPITRLVNYVYCAILEKSSVSSQLFNKLDNQEKIQVLEMVRENNIYLENDSVSIDCYDLDAKERIGTNDMLLSKNLK